MTPTEKERIRRDLAEGRHTLVEGTGAPPGTLALVCTRTGYRLIIASLREWERREQLFRHHKEDPEAQPDQYVTVTEAAKILQRDHSTISHHIATGRLPAITRKRHTWIHIDDLHRAANLVPGPKRKGA